MVTASTHKEYRELVEKLVKNNSETRISNGQSAHAAILIENMFRHANSDIRIYSGDLNNEVYNGKTVIQAAIKFLKKSGTSLKILLQNKRDAQWFNSHELIKAIAEQKAELMGSFDIRIAEGVYATNEAHHFAVMDDKGFRYEIDHANCKAIASFNEPGSAKKMVEVFDFVFEKQSDNTPIDLKIH
jgi:hypothetical protein